MNDTFTRKHMKLYDNLYYFLYKTWEQKSPAGYYHAHEGMEFLYLHEGKGRLIVNDRMHILHPRTLVYFQPYQVHLVQYEQPRVRSLIKFKLPLLRDYLPMFPHLAGFISMLETSREGKQIFQLSPKQDTEMNNQLALFHHAMSTVSVQERKEHFIIFWMQFMSYLKTHILVEPASRENSFYPRQSNHAEKITEWIDEHYKEPFCLEKLADNMHLSASYLSNLFRNYTGNTITEYIMHRRLDEACLLLATTSLQIDQVGKQSGFSNAAYFSRCFKKVHSLTPQQYRSIAVSPPNPLCRRKRFQEDDE